MNRPNLLFSLVVATLVFATGPAAVQADHRRCSYGYAIRTHRHYANYPQYTSYVRQYANYPQQLGFVQQYYYAPVPSVRPYAYQYYDPGVTFGFGFGHHDIHHGHFDLHHGYGGLHLDFHGGHHHGYHGHHGHHGHGHHGHGHHGHH